MEVAYMAKANKKTEFLQIRISKEDKEAIKKLAKAQGENGVSVTELICTTLLGEDYKKEVTK